MVLAFESLFQLGGRKFKFAHLKYNSVTSGVKISMFWVNGPF